MTRGLRDAIQFRAWWAFNRDDDGRCYVIGEEDADLPNLVRSLVSDPEGVEVGVGRPPHVTSGRGPAGARGIT